MHSALLSHLSKSTTTLKPIGPSFAAAPKGTNHGQYLAARAARRRSQAAPTSPIHRAADANSPGVRRYTTRRPSRVPSARPAASSTARCFTTAWRDTGSFAAISPAVAGATPSRSTTRQRVGSASAAKTRSGADAGKRTSGDAAEHSGRVETGLAHAEQCADGGAVELHLDVRRRVVAVGRHPPEREAMRRVELLDHSYPLPFRTVGVEAAAGSGCELDVVAEE